MHEPLYKITAQFLETARVLNDSDFDEQTIRDTLEGLQCPFAEKALDIGAVIKNLTANAFAIEEVISDLSVRAGRLMDRIDWLKKYLLSNMQVTGIRKIPGPLFDISLRKNPPSVEIEDRNLIPSAYMRMPEPPAPYPNKTLIAEALKLNTVVPGAKLSQTERLEIK